MTIDLSSHKTLSSQQRGWPEPMARPAFHGLAGDVVELLEPHSEADRHALLVTFLVAVGSALGPGPGFRAEGDHHNCNLFALMIGDTSKGRKGTSLGRIRQVMGHVDPDWDSTRIMGGLSSGEGLVWQVRDPIVKTVAVKENGKPTGEYREDTEDPGVADKRLLVVESEFSQALKVMKREGNTLSPAIRNLWDRGEQGSLTKNSPAKTTGAHVSIVGHIVRDELRREMTGTELANGFANRFLFVTVRRSKLLPDGGNLNDRDLVEPGQLLAAALDYARSFSAVYERDANARELWHEIYPQLSDGHPGLLGAVTSRAEAQVMRLAVLYTVLDGARCISPLHLRAGLEVWRYCADSARYVFGDALGDAVADEILAALRREPAGMTRTEIRDLFKRHKSAERVDLALNALADHGLARSFTEQTGGRPRERWITCRDKSDTSDQSPATSNGRDQCDISDLTTALEAVG